MGSPPSAARKKPLYAQGLARGSPVAVYVPETGEHRPLAEGRFPWFAASGHVMFSDHETDRIAGTGGGGTLWALPFDLDRLRATGEPVRVREGVHATAEGLAQAYLGRDGTLLYVAGDRTDDRTLVWLDRDGTSHPALDAFPLWTPSR